MRKFCCDTIVRTIVFLLLFGAPIYVDAKKNDFSSWFEYFKDQASDSELYQFLYLMPKGGDLHNHMSGSGFSEWWYELALAEKSRGYIYYTKVKIENCRDYGVNEFSFSPYLLLFRNIAKPSYDKLSECEQGEYKLLSELNEKEKSAWLNSIRLDKSYEGRDEFFQTHWQRLNEIYSNPYVIAEIIYRNMREFSKEGLTYLETQVGVDRYLKPDGSIFSPNEVAQIYRNRIHQKDAKNTGVTVRFQRSILRFLASAEDDLKRMYQFVYDNNDLWVAVNMVGREDNDKGYPLRFLDTLRDLRKKYSGVKLSIHAGEVDEPNFHVRDTLLLGADRIGHGLNLITDSQTMLQMRHGPYLVEINLISNMLLEYVDDYSKHPFPEYLRTSIPVALSTDDRGMWDSTMTDEFFVAVKEFDLSWNELQQLHRNSISYSFLDNGKKSELLENLENRMRKFTRKVNLKNIRFNLSDKKSASIPKPRGFICRRYSLCAFK